MPREEEVEGGADPEVQFPAAEEDATHESDNDGEDSDSHTSDEDVSESSNEGDAVNHEEALKALILSKDDPRRMRLTEEEWHRALDIKAAIADSPGLDNISDFMCAQYAIVCGANIADVLQRATVMQAFREEYNVLDTYEDGCYYLQQMYTLAPGKDLDFGFSEKDGTYIFCHDTTKIDSTQFTTHVKLKAFLAYNYYMSNSWNPDMDSIRKGVICMADCENWDWSKKQDFQVMKKFFSELMAVYPFNGQCRCYNTGVICNMMIAVLKRVLPEEIRNTIKTGYQTDQPLYAYYFVPDRASANNRMFTKMAGALKKRYETEKSFSLMECSLYRGTRSIND